MNQQPDLFTSPPPVAHWRRTDPATSREAAQRVDSVLLQTIVTDWLERQGEHGGTSLECAAATGLDRVTVSPRFAPLDRAGIIVRTKERRDGSIVWKHRRFA